MARTLSAVSAVAAGTTRADLSFTYTGSYDGGNNAAECDGGSGQVYTDVYKRDVTGAGAFVLVTTLAGGTTGTTTYTVTGLTDGRTWEFRANSYQRRQVWNPVDLVCQNSDTGASGDFTSGQITTPSGTLAASTGTFSLSGQAATLRAGRKLSAEAGAYTLAGQAASLVFGRTLTAGAGSYTLTGQAATLRADRRLHPDPGAFTLDGPAVVLRFGYSIQAEPGSFALTGGDVRWMFWDKADPSGTTWTDTPDETTDWTPAGGAETSWAASATPTTNWTPATGGATAWT